MARLFDDASTEYLEIDQSVITGRPTALVCFFRTDDAAATQSLMIVTDKDVALNYFRLYIHGDNNILAFSRSASSAAGAQENTAFSINTWYHACGIFASATDRRVIRSGNLKATNAVNLGAINSLDRMTLAGYRVAGLNTNYLSGMMAEVAIYDLSVWPGATDALKADAFEKILPSLADGFTPLHYPLGLVSYWPLIRGLNDKVGGYNMVASGTVVAAHPRIIQPCNSL